MEPFNRIMAGGMLLTMVGLVISFLSGSESAPCASYTVVVDVTSTADVHNLTEALACTGGGAFDITWYPSVAITQRIEVSNKKNVTVTGNGFPTIRGLLPNNDEADAIVPAGSGTGTGTGIFSVSNGSILHLNGLALEGGNAENGGAVDVLSSSSLFVFDCTFSDNNATNGGEATCVRYKLGEGGVYYLSKQLYIDVWPTFTPPQKAQLSRAD